jgi:hypothetical protein
MKNNKIAGHWVGLLKYNNIYEFFDAYGLFPDKELLWIDLKTRQMLHEEKQYLTNLLRNENYIYNKIKYQNEDNYRKYMRFTRSTSYL